MASINFRPGSTASGSLGGRGGSGGRGGRSSPFRGVVAIVVRE
jgi:hypothetical protein